MEPKGISVTEIRLGLPNTHYYLHWTHKAAPINATQRRAHLADVRAACRRLEWKIYAAAFRNNATQLVFQTSADNLDRGLDGLLRDVRDYQLYMLDPEHALPFIARHVHEPGPNPRSAAGPSELPDIHLGIFMGDRSWAERMLDVLTRCALGADDEPERVPPLNELARSHPDTRDAITRAYRSGRFSLKDIADHFDLHFSEVSAVINTAPQ